MASSSRCPPWVKENPDQQGLVSRSQKYSKLLLNNMQELCHTVIMVGLWVYLISLGVIDTSMKQRLQSHPTDEDQVGALLEYLLRGPCWKLHAFVRALCEDDQPGVVSQILLLNPEEYKGVQEGQDQAATSKQRKKEIKSHRDVYHRTLMNGRLFDIPSLDLPYDMEPVYIKVLATSDGLLTNPEKILPEDILKAKPGKPRPRTALLSGPPGAGKSSFIRYYVYKWCQTEEGQSDWDLIIILNVSTLHLSSGLSPQEHIKEAIRQSLEGRGDKEAIMRSLDDDSLDILIIPDGMDECRSPTILKMLKELISSCYCGKLGFTVLSTCRSGLSQIKDSLFDRRMKIDGFTREEGIKYVTRFYTEIQKPEDDSIYDYIANSTGELDHILTNPLCAHILSVVTADGTLKLRKGQRLPLKTLFQAMEESMKRRQLEKNETQGKKVLSKKELDDQRIRFYKMSLYALLKDLSVLPQSLLDKFQISDQNPYLTFLHKKRTCHMYLQMEDASQWAYNHQMFHEYFSACALEALPEDICSGLLLTISSKEEFRNTQKILFSALGEDVDNSGKLSDMVRVNLITQSKFRRLDLKIRDVVVYVQRNVNKSDLDNMFSTLIPGMEDKMNVDTSKCKEVWQRIRDLYENEAELLQRSGYLFAMDKDVFLIQHIYDCLHEVPEEHRQLVFEQSLGCLLPSMWFDRHGARHMMYNTEGMRWSEVREDDDDVVVHINHSLTDAAEAARQYGQQHLVTFMKDRRLNEIRFQCANTHNESSMIGPLSNEVQHDGMVRVWGDAAHDQIKSKTAWADLISDISDWPVRAQALIPQFGMEDDDGGLAYGPISGFLQSLQMERTQDALRRLLVQDEEGRLSIEVYYGHIDSASLLAWTDWYLQQDLLKVLLYEPTCRVLGDDSATRQEQRRGLYNLQVAHKDLIIEGGTDSDGSDNSDEIEDGSIDSNQSICQSDDTDEWQPPHKVRRVAGTRSSWHQSHQPPLETCQPPWTHRQYHIPTPTALSPRDLWDHRVPQAGPQYEGSESTHQQKQQHQPRSPQYHASTSTTIPTHQPWPEVEETTTQQDLQIFPSSQPDDWKRTLELFMPSLARLQVLCAHDAPIPAQHTPQHAHLTAGLQEKPEEPVPTVMSLGSTPERGLLAAAAPLLGQPVVTGTTTTSVPTGPLPQQEEDAATGREGSHSALRSTSLQSTEEHLLRGAEGASTALPYPTSEDYKRMWDYQ